MKTINADKQHLQWIYDRLIKLYDENPNYDYMIKFMEIISHYTVQPKGAVTAEEIYDKWWTLQLDGKNNLSPNKAVLNAMEEYAQQMVSKAVEEKDKEIDATYNLFNKPAEELKPLGDLWRKENPSKEFTIPDRTEFYKWIRNKIITSQEQKGFSLEDMGNAFCTGHESAGGQEFHRERVLKDFIQSLNQPKP